MELPDALLRLDAEDSTQHFVHAKPAQRFPVRPQMKKEGRHQGFGWRWLSRECKHCKHHSELQ